MQGSITPDKNLVIGALAGLITKITIVMLTKSGITIDTETQGYLIVLAK